MDILGILALVAVLLFVAGCVRACDVFKQLEAESRAREAVLWAGAITVLADGAAARSGTEETHLELPLLAVRNG